MPQVRVRAAENKIANPDSTRTISRTVHAQQGEARVLCPFLRTVAMQRGANSSLSPLGRGDRRGVQLELVRASHECSRRLEGPDVGPVAELGLSVAPDHLEPQEKRRTDQRRHHSLHAWFSAALRLERCRLLVAADNATPVRALCVGGNGGGIFFTIPCKHRFTWKRFMLDTGLSSLLRCSASTRRGTKTNIDAATSCGSRAKRVVVARAIVFPVRACACAAT